jgi:hypothetical protein
VIEQHRQHTAIRIPQEVQRIRIHVQHRCCRACLAATERGEILVARGARSQFSLDHHRIPPEAVTVGNPDDRNARSDTSRRVDDAAAAQGFVVRMRGDDEQRIRGEDGPQGRKCLCDDGVRVEYR